MFRVLFCLINVFQVQVQVQIMFWHQRWQAIIWTCDGLVYCGYMHALGRFYTGSCFAAARRGAVLPRGTVNWIQLISTGTFTLAGTSLAARGKLGPWANLRRRSARFKTNPPAAETVPCVKVPFKQLATVPLPLTNNALCKRSSGNGATRQRSTAPHCSKTAPCIKAALLNLNVFSKKKKKTS